MHVSRRNALLAGAAALATGATTAPVAIQATAVRNALAGDAELFEAIAHWREARDVYEAEEARQHAIYVTLKGADSLEALHAAGYDEDVTDDLNSECWERGLCAVQVPARTLAGLRAKIEMVLVEYPFDRNLDLESELPAVIWRAVVDDIRQLAGETAT